MQGSTELLNSSPEDVLRDAFWLVIHQLQQPGSLPACRGPQWFNGPSTMHGVRVLTGRWLVGGFNRAGQSIPKPFRIIIFVGSCCWDGKKMKTRQLRVLKCPSLSVKLPLVQYLALLQLLQASLRFLCALCCFQCCQALLLQGSMLGRQTMAQISWKTKIKPSTPVLPIPKTEVEVVSNLWCMLIGAKFW